MLRARQEVSKFGQLMDPVADKLVSSAIIALVELGQVSAWVAVLILGREFAVSGLRFCSSGRRDHPGQSLGQTEDGKQVVAITAMLIQLPGPTICFGWQFCLLLDPASSTSLRLSRIFTNP